MPARTPRPCRQTGCWGLVTSRDGLCEKHRKAQHRQYSKRRTDKAATRTYQTKRWRELRSAHLADNPFCARCGAFGEVVHHIREHGGDPALAYDPTNLETLCTACHNRAHLRGVARQQTR